MIRLFLMTKLLGIGGNFGGICWVVCSFRQWRGYGCVWYVGETERIRVSLSSQEDTAQLETVFGMTNHFLVATKDVELPACWSLNGFRYFGNRSFQVLKNCPKHPMTNITPPVSLPKSLTGCLRSAVRTRGVCLQMQILSSWAGRKTIKVVFSCWIWEKKHVFFVMIGDETLSSYMLVKLYRLI